MAGKITVVAVCLLLAGVLYLWSRLQGAAEPVPGAALLLALLPITYVASFLLSSNRAVGLIGTGIETDTLLFVTLAFVAALLGSLLFRTGESARLFVRTLFLTFGFVALFQCVVLIFGLPGPFTDHSVNLIGKWNDFGASLMVLAFILLIELEFGHLSTLMRRLSAALLVVVLVLLGAVNFNVAWAMLLVVSLAFLVVRWLSARKVAWGALVAGVVAGAFLFFGAALNAQLSKVIPVTSLEIRPALQATFDVTTAAHGASAKNAALGTGPNTFGLTWLTYKPLAVNQSQFWNLDFTVGFSTLATAFSSVGLLGAIMWLLPALLVLFGLWRNRSNQEHRVLSWTVAGVALLLWSVIILYVPSPDVLLLAFAAAGVAIGVLWRGGVALSNRALSAAFMIVLFALVVWTAGTSVRRVLAESYVGQSTAALQANNLDLAQSLAARSVAIEPTPENLRLLTQVDASKLAALAAAAKPESQQAFKDLLNKIVGTSGANGIGQQSIALDPQDYRSYLSLAQVYDFLATNKVQGAFENAKAAYLAAAKLSPLNPLIWLSLAKLEASVGTVQGVQDALKQSLTLKPDYTDAILFLAQIDIARNDLASAIKDTQIAVQTAPGVPSIWLELGLLYYAGGDAKDAIAPLEQALKLQPDYANAQYFLAVSYAAQGRTQDALTLFERLAQTNPDSAEVKAAIANMQAGRQPLDDGTKKAAAKK